MPLSNIKKLHSHGQTDRKTDGQRNTMANGQFHLNYASSLSKRMDTRRDFFHYDRHHDLWHLLSNQIQVWRSHKYFPITFLPNLDLTHNCI